MGWRFRKSIKVAPGLRVNLGKRGPSVSASIPGTGISYSTARQGGSSPGPASSLLNRPISLSGCIGCLGVAGAGGFLLLVFLAITAGGGRSRRPATYTPTPTLTPAATTEPGGGPATAASWAPSTPSEPAAPTTAENLAFVRAKLGELDAIRRTEKFRFQGFGGDGVYAPWMESVKAMHARQEKGRDVPGRASFTSRAAVGELMSLGMSYVFSRGEENDTTRRERAAIMEALKEAPARAVVNRPLGGGTTRTREPDPYDADAEFEAAMEAMLQSAATRPKSERAAPSDAARAATLLRMGDALSKQGKREPAEGYYRRVAEEFPDTPAADEARARLGGE